MRCLLIGLLLVCSACIQIGSDPQPLNYYLLESPENQPHVYSGKALNISIELTKFPEYLDRLQIVTDNQKNTVNINETERWAAPLRDNILQVVRTNLAQSFPEGIVVVHPWDSVVEPVTKLKMKVDHFGGKPGEAVNVIVRWQIERPAKETIHGTFSEKQPIGAAFTDLVAGLNSSLNRFSQLLAEELARQ